jgi:hypothetical protein
LLILPPEVNFHVDSSKKSSISSFNIPKVSKNVAKSPSGDDLLHGHRSLKQPAHARDHSPEKRGAKLLNWNFPAYFLIHFLQAKLFHCSPLPPMLVDQ